MLPSVLTASEGFRTTVKKLIAALGVEFQLLRAERSLIVLAPLAIFFSILELAFTKLFLRSPIPLLMRAAQPARCCFSSWA
jgi:hypothetical protein